jgi:hypothetical protein
MSAKENTNTIGTRPKILQVANFHPLVEKNNNSFHPVP